MRGTALTPWLVRSVPRSFLFPPSSFQTDLVLAAPDHGLGELELVAGHVQGLPRGLLDRGDGDRVHSGKRFLKSK